MALYIKTNNLFNKSRILLNSTDFSKCTDYSISEDKNILVVTGNPANGADDFSYQTGWVQPTAYSTRYSSGGVLVKIGDVITVSADFTLIEQGPRTPQVRCYFYCQDNENHCYTSANQKNISETKTRLSWTFNMTKAEERYFPVFPINSNRVQIENIMISKNGKAVYEPFGGIKVKPVIRSKLSTDYQPIEYIESNGTQFIDTEFYPTKKTKFCADLYFDYTNDKLSSTTAGFMGISADFSINFGSGDNQKQQVFFWLNAFNNDNANSNATSSYVPQNTKTYFELNAKNRTYVCGIRSGDVITEKTTDSKYSACLFGYKKSADNYAAIHPFTFFPMRLYTCKFYDDDKLMRDFIPCYRKSDGAVGLFDLVTDKFYGNAGTGEFLKGSDVVTTKNFTDYYQTVEYIESTGTQYIDTGVNLIEDLFFDIKCKHNSAGGLFGRYPASDSSIVIWQSLSADRLVLGYGYDQTSSEYMRYEVQEAYDIHTVKVADYKVIIDDKVVVENQTAKLKAMDEPFYLFRQSSIYGSGRIYYAKLYIGNTIIRNFIPCYRKSDGEIGLYDLVSMKFYSNNGTGSFLKGEDISIPTTDFEEKLKKYKIIPRIKNPNNLVDLSSIGEYISYNSKNSDYFKFTKNPTLISEDKKYVVKFDTPQNVYAKISYKKYDESLASHMRGIVPVFQDSDGNTIGDLSTHLNRDGTSEKYFKNVSAVYFSFGSDWINTIGEFIVSLADEPYYTSPVKGIRNKENLIPFPYIHPSTTYGGITYTIQEDGGIRVVGTSTVDYPTFQIFAVKTWTPTSIPLSLEPGCRYTLSGGKDGVIVNARLGENTNSTTVWLNSSGGYKATATWIEGNNIATIGLTMTKGVTVDTVIYPMFVKGNVTKPYFSGVKNK